MLQHYQSYNFMFEFGLLANMFNCGSACYPNTFSSCDSVYWSTLPFHNEVMTACKNSH